MREILFRGKRVDDNKWVYGNYCFCDVFTTRKHYILQNEVLENSVIPETVGQYTGLTDMHGRKIFEGDIVKEIFEGENSDERESVEFYGCKIGNVTFNGSGTFICAKYGELYINGEIAENYMPAKRKRLSSWRCAVIGNIHDNPELLHGGKDDG